MIAPITKFIFHINPSNIVETNSAIKGIIMATYAASFEPIFLMRVKYRVNPNTLPKIER